MATPNNSNSRTKDVHLEKRAELSPSRQGLNAAEAVAELQAEELRVEHAICARLPAGVMIDVGAHHGSTLAPFLDAGWAVIAFEPIPANREVLHERFQGRAGLTVRGEAVSDHAGTGQLRLALKLDGTLHDYYHSLEQTRADRYHRKGSVLDVPLISLNHLLERGEVPARVGFLKIDTEGHDLAVLRGATKLRCSVVGVEFWGDRHPLGRSPSPAKDVIGLLNDQGYRHYLVISHEGNRSIGYGSSLDQVSPEAWGNIFFFHDDYEPLYRELLAESRPPSEKPSAPVDRRLARLLTLVMNHRPASCFASYGAGHDPVIEHLLAQLPGSKRVPVTDAVSADLVCCSGGDAMRFLRESTGVMTPNGPLVLFHVDFSTESGQQDFAELTARLQTAGLWIAGFFQPQTNEDGVLVNTDLLAVPSSVVREVCSNSGPAASEDSEVLLEELRVLQRACDERLALVQELQRVCDERLELIVRLERDLRSSHTAFNNLRKVHEESVNARTTARSGEWIEPPAPPLLERNHSKDFVEPKPTSPTLPGIGRFWGKVSRWAGRS